MAKEYIEREAALEIVNGWREGLILTYGENDEYVKCLETVAKHLDIIPAADVRPVVRCEECEYAILAPSRKTATCMKSTLRNTHGYDWFCADGKRFEVQDDD